MTDPLSKVNDMQNIFEKIASKIPGFGGYLEKEKRRDADKILRETLAARYEEQWQRVSAIQRRMVEELLIEHVDQVEAAALKLRIFIDGMRTAAYGYGDMFGAVKVKEAELDKLYRYDQELLEGVGRVTSAVDNLEASLGSDGFPAALRNLVNIAAECVTAFERRRDVIMS